MDLLLEQINWGNDLRGLGISGLRSWYDPSRSDAVYADGAVQFTAADTLVTALNSALATYVSSVDFAKTENDLAEAYKTAAGAETTVSPGDGE